LSSRQFTGKLEAEIIGSIFFSCGGGHLETGIRVNPGFGKSASLVQAPFAGHPFWYRQLDFGGRKNELRGREIGGNVVGFAFALGQLGEEYGFLDGLLPAGEAFGPKCAELGHVPLDGALDTLLVKRQQLDVLAVIEPGSGLRQGLADFRLVDFAGVLERAGVRFIRQLAESEDAGFEGAGAIKAPAVLSDRLRDIDFQGRLRGEGFADAFAVSIEGGLLSGGENVDLTSQAVTIGVEARAMLAFRGRGSGGVL
jgi:hypothetical protein